MQLRGFVQILVFGIAFACGAERLDAQSADAQTRYDQVTLNGLLTELHAIKADLADADEAGAALANEAGLLDRVQALEQALQALTAQYEQLQNRLDQTEGRLSSLSMPAAQDDDAPKLSEQAVQLDPISAYAQKLMQKGQSEEALRFLNEALNEGGTPSEHTQWRLMRADLYNALGQTDAAGGEIASLLLSAGDADAMYQALEAGIAVIAMGGNVALACQIYQQSRAVGGPIAPEAPLSQLAQNLDCPAL